MDYNIVDAIVKAVVLIICGVITYYVKPMIQAKVSEQNLETIKLLAIAKVFDETHYYRDNTKYNELRVKSGSDAEVPYDACNQMNTFAHLLARIYVSEILGSEEVERITDLTRDLINAYKELVSETEWLEDQSKEKIINYLIIIVV